MYSYNPEANSNAIEHAQGKGKKDIKRAQEDAEHLVSACKKYKIDKSRICYMIPHKTKAQFCAEKPEVYEHFIDTHHTSNIFTADTWVIRDAGTAYINKNKQSVIKAAGIQNDVTLPPICHHSFSVNDHSLHGATKVKWRSKEAKNELESTLMLMQEIDNVAKKDIEKWFTRNYLYQTFDKSANERTKAMKELLFGKSMNWKDHHDEGLAAFYEKFPDKRIKPKVVKPKKVTRGKVIARNQRV